MPLKKSTFLLRHVLTTKGRDDAWLQAATLTSVASKRQGIPIQNQIYPERILWRRSLSLSIRALARTNRLVDWGGTGSLIKPTRPLPQSIVQLWIRSAARALSFTPLTQLPLCNNNFAGFFCRLPIFNCSRFYFAILGRFHFGLLSWDDFRRCVRYLVFSSVQLT